MRRIFSYLLMVPLLTAALWATGTATLAQASGLPAGVIGTPWKLIAIQRSAQNPLDTTSVNITLEFDAQGHASGTSTCNSYGVSYQAGAGQSLKLTDLISTLRACVDQSRMDLEGEYYAALQGVTAYRFDGTTLELVYDNGGALRFAVATATPPTTVPGMPVTGAGSTDYGLWLAAGLLLAVLGVVCRGSLQRRKPAL